MSEKFFTIATKLDSILVYISIHVYIRPYLSSKLYTPCLLELSRCKELWYKLQKTHHAF